MKIQERTPIDEIPACEGAPPIQVEIGFSGLIVLSQSEFSDGPLSILVDSPQLDRLIAALEQAKAKVTEVSK